MPKTSKWADILNYHIEDTDNGFHVLRVDAYKTANDDEEGVVIATLVGINKDGEPHIYTAYHDADARVDTYAKAVIKESEQKLTDYLKTKSNSKGE